MDFADAFDRDLLILWRYAEQDETRFNVLIAAYPNATRTRISKRLTSQAFLRKGRIRYVVKGGFIPGVETSNTFISLLALLIFLALLLIAFD